MTGVYPVKKPTPRAKAGRQPLKRTRMKQRPSKVVRDRERMAFVASQPCVVCRTYGMTQRSKTQADHVRTRGAGGGERGNLWPLCARHHDERHRLGLKSFQYEYALDAKEIAEVMEIRFVNGGTL